jgi:hypothetical protein
MFFELGPKGAAVHFCIFPPENMGGKFPNERLTAAATLGVSCQHKDRARRLIQFVAPANESLGQSTAIPWNCNPTPNRPSGRR